MVPRHAVRRPAAAAEHAAPLEGGVQHDVVREGALDEGALDGALAVHLVPAILGRGVPS